MRVPVPLEVEQTATAVLSAAYHVHTEIGPGCLERVYTECLAHVLRSRGHVVATEVYLPVVFDGRRIEIGYRLDMLVDGEVIVEVKAVDSLVRRNFSQVMTYLKLSGRPVAWLFNFGEDHLKDGDHRIVHPGYESQFRP